MNNQEDSTRDVFEILGIVSPNGVTGFGGPSNSCSILFGLEAWRHWAGPIEPQPIIIEKQVEHSEIGEMQEAIKPYDIVRLKTGAIHFARNRLRADLVQFMGVYSNDGELIRLAAKLQEPVAFKDARFGEFVLDKRVKWFEAKTLWDGLEIRLRLATGEDSAPEKLLPTAHQLWDSAEVWSRRISDYAAAELLNLKNTSWLSEDETELTEDQFKKRLQLESISICPGGEFEFWFDDGDLFWGHYIGVLGSLTDGPRSTEIYG